MKNIFNIIWKYVHALYEDIMDKRVIGTASNLTYSSLLAFVPIMAVVFAIARGFGYSIYIEEWFLRALDAQQAAAHTIIGFVNSYLVHTQKGIFLGIGLLFMLWTVLMLISNIEQAFNDIWQVKRQRSVFRTVTDYISLLFFIPIALVITSGLNVWVTALDTVLKDIIILGPIMEYSLELTPYVLWSAAFTALYIFMPNTKVEFKAAIWPGIIAGICMQIFQIIYINSQIWISNYNAIYGSFAIIPFFLLWLQTSWIICLLGAELCYCRQNADDFFNEKYRQLSFNERVGLSWKVMQHVIKRFEKGQPALTSMDIKKKLNVPMRIVTDILYDLQRINFLAELTTDEKGDTTQYLPSQGINNITEQTIREKLADLG